MKMIVAVALAFVALAAAAPAEEPKYVQIVRSAFEPKPDGGYDFGYESQDGSTRQEQGEVKVVPDEDNKPQSVIVVRGTYSYLDSDGSPVSITYTADENGYRAEGDSIPKVPAARR